MDDWSSAVAAAKNGLTAQVRFTGGEGCLGAWNAADVDSGMPLEKRYNK